MADKTLTPTESYIDNTSVQGKAAGWTHHLVFDYTAFSTANLGTAADDDTATAAVAVGAGDCILNAAVYLETDFQASTASSGDDLEVSVGDDTEKDNFIAVAAIHADDTPITYVLNTGASLDNENGKIWTAADNIEIRFHPNADSDAAYSLNELESGKVHVYLDVRKLT